MAGRTPVSASLEAQLVPTRLCHCDPGEQPGYRIAFYGDDGSWSQVETEAPVMTHEEAFRLIAAAEAAVSKIGQVAA